MKKIEFYKGTICENCIQCGLCLEMDDFEEIKVFEGDIFIISDGKFIKTLTADEFKVYYSFLGVLSKNDGKGKHLVYKKQLNFSELALELRLKGRTEGSIMTRQSLKSAFDSLVKKKVFKLAKLNKDEVYYIMTTQNYMFTRMPKETYTAFSKTLSGDALKMFCYIKGNLDNVKSKGGNVLYISRTKIASECGITNNKGQVGERQLKTVGTILKTLGSFGVIDYAMVKVNVDGKIKSRYEVYGVNTNIKKENQK